MKHTTLFLATAGAALAQNLSGQPACATACLSSAISAAGCQPSDTGCQCAPGGQAAIGASAAPCLLASCAASDLLQAQSAGAAVCARYSATATTASQSSSPPAAAASTDTNTGFSASSGGGSHAESLASTTTKPTPGCASKISRTASATGDVVQSTSASTAGAAAAAATPVVMGVGAVLGVLGAVAGL
ncbi:hypothetical protein VTK56DRAFT_6049 [Thermocarpiscus australiensis]